MSKICSISTVSFMTFISRILEFIRDIVAQVFGINASVDGLEPFCYHLVSHMLRMIFPYA